MLTGIDHLVVAVPDLQEAMQNYRELGFDVVVGGEHPNAVGSHNALIAFEDRSYIEIIAFKNPDPAQHPWVERLNNGGGLVDYCMQSDDLAGDVAASHDAGVATDGVKDGARARPDGYEVKWRSARVSETEGAIRGLPFIIEDVTPRDERVPLETAHANGVMGIETAIVVVPEIDTARAWYRRLMNTEGEQVIHEEFVASGYRYRIGPHTIDYVVPAGVGSPVNGVLQVRKATLYAVSLKTPAAKNALLDMNKTLNARFSLV